MHDLFDPHVAQETKDRVGRLPATAERRWGRMNPAQMMAHCAAAMAMATGELRLPRVLLGRLLGRWVKAKVLADATPFSRNSPTARELKIAADLDLDTERARLLAVLDRFLAAGPAGCRSHPHPFFGPLTPREWAVLAYKHLDHHLRQFGA